MFQTTQQQTALVLRDTGYESQQSLVNSSVQDSSTLWVPVALRFDRKTVQWTFWFTFV